MSPRYFTALVKRHREIRKAEQDRADFRAGKIAQAVVNASGGWPVDGQKEGKRAEVPDFFPWLAEVMGAGEPADESGAFIAALRDQGLIEKRGG